MNGEPLALIGIFQSHSTKTPPQRIVTNLARSDLQEQSQTILSQLSRVEKGGFFHLSSDPTLPLPDNPWDGLYATQEVVNLTKTSISWEPCGAFPIAGQVFPLFKKGVQLSQAIVGHLPARNAFEEFLAKNKQSAFTLTGEIGIGKSVFTDYATDYAQTLGWETINKAFNPGRSDIFSEFQISAQPSPQDQAVEIHEAFLARSALKKYLFIFENLHWASKDELKIISLLARREQDSYRLFLTSRPQQGIPQGITLSPLDQSELHELIPDLSEKDLPKLYSWSGGHPLLALELAKSWKLDASRRKKLGSNITDRPGTHHEALKLASLISQRLLDENSAPLFALSSLRGNFSKEIANSIWTQLNLQGQLNDYPDVIRQREDGTYQFHHQLLRLAIEEVSPLRPQTVYQSVLAKILQNSDLNSEAAHHWQLANQPENAFSCLAKEAEKNLSRAAFSQAYDQAELATQLTPEKDNLTWTKAFAAHGMGNHQIAYEHFSTALIQAEIAIPKDSVLSLTQSLLIGASNRPYPKALPSDLLHRATRAFHIRSESDWLLNRLNSCLLNILKAQQLALQLPKDNALRSEVTAAGSLALASLLPRSTLEKRFNQALANPDSHSQVEVFYLIYRMGQNDWFAIKDRVTESRLTTTNRKIAGSIGFLEIAATHFSGDTTLALSLTQKLVQEMSDYGEKNLTGLARGTEACLLAHTSHPAAGLRILEEAPQLKKVAQHEYYALLTSLLFANGDYQQAAKNFELLIQTINLRPMVNYAFLMIFPGWGETTLGLHQLGLISRKHVKFVLKFYRKQTRLHPNHRSLLLGFESLYLKTQGQPRKAITNLNKAISSAEKAKLGFAKRYLEAHAHYLDSSLPAPKILPGEKHNLEHFWKITTT